MADLPTTTKEISTTVHELSTSTPQSHTTTEDFILTMNHSYHIYDHLFQPTDIFFRTMNDFYRIYDDVFLASNAGPFTNAVYELPEMMENIITHLPTTDILQAKLISQYTNSLITTSPSIIHELLFPTEQAPAAAFVPNALGTTNFFIVDQEKWFIMKPDNLCSLQLAPSERGDIELYYHLHPERHISTILPPLTDAQKQTILFPRKASTRVNVTNWSPLNPSWMWNDLWMTFSIHVKSCRLQDLTNLVEKLNVMLYLINEKEAREVEKADDWKIKLIELVEEKNVVPGPQLTEHEKAMFVDGSKLEVGFGHWWNVLRNEYRDI
ncbi:unnamed protein product [Zymoseptoria tritici ST99CH_1E4]|uniref:F-box domain-containing protein n=1 Tax=Zymoseptoria tritici ST99CH_1E4 TaxID=1276532 RepID=A0A2H1GQF3_ZYMTR|nr:unnamed protein product [Zymoseptoria tritici ST99CH_1E4]